MLRNYADIIVDISHEKVDRPFQYRIPDSLRGSLAVGACVRIPFGRGNTERKGYIIEITDTAKLPPERLKEIIGTAPEDASAEGDSVRLAAWMKRQYGSTMIQALKTVLPVKKKIKPLVKKSVVLSCESGRAQEALTAYRRKHQYARERVLSELLREGALPYELVTGKLRVSPATLKCMEEQEIIAIHSDSYYRNPVKQTEIGEERKSLSAGQSSIVTDILGEYDKGHRGTYLIHGITGSGKTEVYIRLIEELVRRGKQSIMLIPEIALTYQTLLRFYRHFGDRVSVMNSTLSQGEKTDQFERARRGELDVMIGPRSALFTPFTRLGLIVIDEEHENSYKSETMPKYHARETAQQIASMQGADVVLGSATPSLESYYRAKRGEYKLYTLKERLAGGSLPAVYTVDLRQEMKEGNRSIFSRKLTGLLKERLDRGEQSMLFLNRRGVAGFVSCRLCGHVMKCPHCDVSLSEHQGGRLVCHYCGYEEKAVKLCPECGSPYLLGFRAGTQQIEQTLARLFPQAVALRMDADTTRTKGSYERILSSFAEGAADILVGTQMIVKGHDFPNVTLVGILAADLSLCINDYRAAERTFQLLTQAAGRAGRGEKPGEVVIQTYQPEHYGIVHAAAQDYEGFYEEEMLYREMLDYPPAAHMLAVLITGPDEEACRQTAERLAALAKRRPADGKAGTLLIGPAPASVGKLNDRYRFVIYLKDREYDRLVSARDRMEDGCVKMISETGKTSENISVQFDFDPMNSY